MLRRISFDDITSVSNGKRSDLEAARQSVRADHIGLADEPGEQPGSPEGYVLTGHVTR
jgi:hypothetical protein